MENEDIIQDKECTGPDGQTTILNTFEFKNENGTLMVIAYSDMKKLNTTYLKIIETTLKALSKSKVRKKAKLPVKYNMCKSILKINS